MQCLIAILVAAISTGCVVAPLAAAESSASVTLEDIARIFSAPAEVIGHVVAGWRDLDEIPNVQWAELPPRITPTAFEREGTARLQEFGPARLRASGPRAGVTEILIRTETGSSDLARLLTAQFSALTTLRKIHDASDRSLVTTAWEVTLSGRKPFYLTMDMAPPASERALRRIVFRFLLDPPERTVYPVDSASTEIAVCGFFREPFMFWLWRMAAGFPNANRVVHLKGIEPIRFKTRDGIELAGYKLEATEAKGYLLVAQGNATLADQLMAELEPFRDLGFDVYVFDYRGYGTSQGKSRLAAIVGDYAEIVSYLNTLGYAQRLLYGISMGGIILLNAAGRSEAYDRLVIDSSPGRISDRGCPREYDPVEHVPEDASRLMIISGDRDTVVTPAQMDELIQVTGSRGARVVQDNEFAHPHQDSYATHQRRQNEIIAFLLQK